MSINLRCEYIISTYMIGLLKIKELIFWIDSVIFTH